MRRAAVLLVIGMAIMLVATVAWAARVPSRGLITVTASLDGANRIPLPPEGRRGDNVDVVWRITDRNGRRVGRMLVRCRWVTRTARLCDGELQMPKGKISFSGGSPTRFQGEYAVTGGTGVYLGVGGSMRFTSLGQAKNALLVALTT